MIAEICIFEKKIVYFSFLETTDFYRNINFSLVKHSKYPENSNYNKHSREHKALIQTKIAPGFRTLLLFLRLDKDLFCCKTLDFQCVLIGSGKTCSAFFSKKTPFLTNMRCCLNFLYEVLDTTRFLLSQYMRYDHKFIQANRLPILVSYGNFSFCASKELLT